jgi:hypothetical protein
MPKRKTIEEVNNIIALYNSGYTQNEIFKTLGIDRGTIRQIINDPDGYLSKSTKEFSLSDIDKKSYAFLLGIYLGDGCISKTHKDNVYKLRILCDNRYINILNEISKSISIILPDNKVSINRHGSDNCSEIYVYSKNLIQLFPQHDTGKKHERQIILEDWQKEIIDEYNLDFFKGLMYSDGSFYFSGKYERANFTNKSIDIINLCSESMKKLNINHKIRTKISDNKYYCYVIQIQNRKEMSKITFRKN